MSARGDKAQRLADVLADMYVACTAVRPELAIGLDRIVTGNEHKPELATVRAYLSAVCHGALAEAPPTPRRKNGLLRRLLG